MQNSFAQYGTCAIRGCVALLSASVLCASALAAATTDPGGQWLGQSKVEGHRIIDKTTLSLVADNASMRIEESTGVCVLEQGTYTAQNSGSEAGWSLSFKQSKGSDACAKLAQANFTLSPGSRARTLDFEVTYTGTDGKQNRRFGALSRYP
jgi:hypothetical protein